MFGYASLRTAEDSLDRQWPVLPARYEIKDRLGGGSGGSVYLAYDTMLKRFVAIKVPIGWIAGEVAQEAISQAAIEHVNVPRLLDAGDTLEERVFVSMEYVDGEDILSHCQREQVSLRDRVKLLRQVCSAVHYVHSDADKASVHRDIRAANILVTRKDGIPKVMDFGMAARIDCEHSDAPSVVGEETSNWLDRGVEVDLYSIGILAWQLLTGEPASGNAHRLDRQNTQEVDELRQNLVQLIDKGTIDDGFAHSLRESSKSLRRKLTGDLAHILQSAIRRGDHSYQTVRELEEDLTCYLDRYPLKSKPASPRDVVVRFVQRNALFSTTAALLSTIVAVVGVALYLSRGELFESRQREGGLNDQLAKAYQATNPERPVGKSAKRVPKTMIDMLSEAARVRNSGSPLSEKEIRRVGQTADTLSANGLHHQAVAQWKLVYQNQVRQHGEGAPYAIAARILLAAATLKTGKGEEALQLGLKNVEFLAKLELPHSNKLWLWNAHVLASAQEFGGHYEVAIGIEEQVLAKNDDRDTELWADASQILAIATFKNGNAEEAAKILEDVIDFYKVHRGTNNPRTLTTMANYATTLQKLGREAEAIEQMQAVVDGFKAIYPDGGRLLEHHRLVNAVLLGNAEKYTEASNILRELSIESSDQRIRLTAVVELLGIQVLRSDEIESARQRLLDLIPEIERKFGADSALHANAKRFLKIADESLSQPSTSQQ